MYSLDDKFDTLPSCEEAPQEEILPKEAEELADTDDLAKEIEEFEQSSEICDVKPESETTKTTTVKIKKFSFHLLSSTLTFVLLPHFWCFSIPAIIFARESKRFFKAGNIHLSKYFADKAKRFVVSSWLITAVVALIVAIFSFVIGLSTI